MCVGGIGFSRQLNTLDEDENYFNNANNSSNVFNNISNVNTVNSNANNAFNTALNKLQALRQNLTQSAAKASSPSTPSETTCLSFSLTRQYILYDIYRLGSEKKSASLIVGQSPYTSPQESQTVASMEEIDAELDKVKELFASGFIQQEDYISRIQSLNAQKVKAVGN
eukprot:TRINITY_DN666_c0_g1_i2.p1 TRINITY_DN666_c0_g1~~TRINITY_DN666_c0_g1_i2.p1  ORF type:complete len:168 (+),score=19.71 TRINITY_DN666_c0_g1_i2:200-703(+)